MKKIITIVTALIIALYSIQASAFNAVMDSRSVSIPNNISYAFTSDRAISSEINEERVMVLIFVKINADSSYFMIDDINSSEWASNKNVRVAAIDVTGADAEVLSMYKKAVDSSSIEIASDEKKTATAESFAELVGINSSELSYPFTVVIDQNKNISYYAQGYCKPDVIKKVVENVSINPEVPKNLLAVRSEDGDAKISWGKVNAANGYKLYRSKQENENYSEIITITNNTETSFMDTDLEEEENYYYKIRSFVKGTFSDINGEYSKSSMLSTSLEISETIKLERKALNSISISWDPIVGATKYIVYRQESEDQEPQELCVTSDTTVLMEIPRIDVKYTYKVNAIRHNRVAAKTH